MRLYSVYYEYNSADNLFENSIQEPLTIFAMSPLYWLATQHEALGMVHTVWLFNVIVTAAIGAMVYQFGRRMGYGFGPSLLTAFSLGVGTMLYPYSQFAFRENFAALWVLAIFFLVTLPEPAAPARRWALAAVLLVLALLTKEALLSIMPAILLLFWNRTHLQQQAGWLLAGLIAVTLVSVVFVVGLIQLIPGLQVFNLQDYTRLNNASPRYFITVVLSYWLSPGRSLWATNPILLAGVVGSLLWFRAGQRHLALGPWVCFISLTVGYGLLDRDWHGGLGWGVRYLVPVIPVMGLLLLPVWDTVLKSGQRLAALAMGGLLFISVAIQLGGVLVPLNVYFDHMLAEFPQKGAEAYYDEGNWLPQHTQWWVSLGKIDLDTLPFGWQFAESEMVALAVVALLLAVGLALLRWQRRGVLAAAIVLSVAGLGLFVTQFQYDPRINADRDALWQTVALVNAQAERGDVVVLSSPLYRDFFLNTYRGDAPLVVLPFTPYEQYTPGVPPLLDNFNGIKPIATATSFYLDQQHDRFETAWLVIESGPFTDWSFRLTERAFWRQGYPIQQWEPAADVRLIQYDTVPPLAYEYMVPLAPAHQFGDGLRLAGYNLPREVAAGDRLRFELAWQRIAQIDSDYNIRIGVIDENGAAVAGLTIDRPPQMSLGFTSQWEAFAPQKDAYALPLPAELPAGPYHLSIALYDWRDGKAVSVVAPDDVAPLREDAAIIGPFWVGDAPTRATDTLAPATELDTPIILSDGLRLVGLDMPSQARRGATLAFTSTWDIQNLPIDTASIVFRITQRDEARTFMTSSLTHPFSLIDGGLQGHAQPQTFRHDVWIPPDFATGTYSFQVIVMEPRLGGMVLSSGGAVSLGTIEVIEQEPDQ